MLALIAFVLIVTFLCAFGSYSLLVLLLSGTILAKIISFIIALFVGAVVFVVFCIIILGVMTIFDDL